VGDFGSGLASERSTTGTESLPGDVAAACSEIAKLEIAEVVKDRCGDVEIDVESVSSEDAEGKTASDVVRSGRGCE